MIVSNGISNSYVDFKATISNIYSARILYSCLANDYTIADPDIIVAIPSMRT